MTSSTRAGTSRDGHLYYLFRSLLQPNTYKPGITADIDRRWDQHGRQKWELVKCCDLGKGTAWEFEQQMLYRFRDQRLADGNELLSLTGEQAEDLLSRLEAKASEVEKRREEERHRERKAGLKQLFGEAARTHLYAELASAQWQKAAQEVARHEGAAEGESLESSLTVCVREAIKEVDRCWAQTCKLAREVGDLGSQELTEARDKMTSLKSWMEDVHFEVLLKGATVEAAKEVRRAKQKASDFRWLLQSIDKRNRQALQPQKNRPASFQQQLRYYPQDVVEEYANASTTLLRVARGCGEKVLRRLAQFDEPFRVAADRTARLRWWQETARNAYIQNLQEMVEVLQEPPGDAPGELRRRAFDSWKLALMAERHYDHGRNQWVKMGLAMQGKGSEASFKAVFEDVTGKPFNPSEAAAVSDGPDLKAADMTIDSSIGRVIHAANAARFNLKEGIALLEAEILDARINGVDPAKQRRKAELQREAEQRKQAEALEQKRQAEEGEERSADDGLGRGVLNLGLALAAMVITGAGITQAIVWWGNATQPAAHQIEWTR